MRIIDGVSGCIELFELLPLLLVLRGKKTSPFVFGCEQDGLGGGLGKLPGEPVIYKTNKLVDELKICIFYTRSVYFN